jgi:hypothetical protein
MVIREAACSYEPIQHSKPPLFKRLKGKNNPYCAEITVFQAQTLRPCRGKGLQNTYFGKIAGETRKN